MTIDVAANGAALFSSQAHNYSRLRPSYPQEVYDLILSHLNQGQRDLAVDVATGNGQAAVQLAQHFSQVLATDGNEEQLRHATPAPNVTYQHADAHSIPLPDASVDVITAASALHWFDLPRFYKECRRVLRPHGCVAAWCIPMGCAKLDVPAAPAAAAAGCQAALHFIHEETLGDCWDKRKRLCDDMYTGVSPSLHEFSTVLMRRLSMPVELSVDELVGYASTWSAYSIYRQRHPTKPDPLREYRAQLVAALEGQGLAADSATVLAHIPVAFVLAQHPVA